MLPLTSPVWLQYVPAATVISGFATAFAVIVGAISLFLIWRQTRLSGEVTRSATAAEAHKDYLKLCIEYPELSSSDMMLQYLGAANFEGILTAGTVKSEKALWFASLVLYTMEQLVQTNMIGKTLDASWVPTVEAQISYHHTLLLEVWPHWESHYCDEMRRIVRSVIYDDPNPE